MPKLRIVIVIVVLVLVAFGIGYGLGYWKLQKAEKECSAAKAEMQTKIGTLEKEVSQARARESLWEISGLLDQTSADLSEKNFGLAIKNLDKIKDLFAAAQPNLDAEVKTRFDFLLPAVEEARKEAENLSPNAQKKAEEIRGLFNQSMRPPRKG